MGLIGHGEKCVEEKRVHIKRAWAGVGELSGFEFQPRLLSVGTWANCLPFYPAAFSSVNMWLVTDSLATITLGW